MILDEVLIYDVTNLKIIFPSFKYLSPWLHNQIKICDVRDNVVTYGTFQCKTNGKVCDSHLFLQPFHHAQTSCCNTLLLFFFWVSHTYWHQICDAWRCSLEITQRFVHARQTKNGYKMWVCVQSQCKLSVVLDFS